MEARSAIEASVLEMGEQLLDRGRGLGRGAPDSVAATLTSSVMLPTSASGSGAGAGLSYTGEHAEDPPNVKETE